MAFPVPTLSPMFAVAFIFAAATAVLAATPDPPSASPGATDPLAWLEDIHGARALAWVAAQNTRTAGVLERDPRYDTFHRQALEILTAEDRIPDPDFLGADIENFWQDASHVKGVWRRTTPASYASDTPVWETLLDLDALSKAEGRNWIFKGDQCLAPDDRLCLVRLSDGGGDAVQIREYDTQSKAFVSGGFHFDTGKQDVAWVDADTVLIARDWGPGTVTQSGYPFVIKRMKRGQPTADAIEVYRGAPDDVGASPRVFRDADGKVAVVVLERHVGFFETDYVTLGAGGATHPLDLPKKSDVQGYLAGRLIVSLNEDWAAGPARPAFTAGSLIALDPASGAAALIVRPTATQTIDTVAVTRSRVLVKLLDNVSGALDVYAPRDGGWTHRRLALPTGSALEITAVDHGSDHAYVSAESFLEPTTLWALDAAAGTVAKVKSLAPRFDASRDTVAQHFAISTDGTRIPYFLVSPKAMTMDGSTPTLMFGYGGFQVSLTPTYHAELGKLWLERGGAYVLANIRGGGEFGPAWHEAARRENRQRAFDDFAAVAKDLIARKITSPRRLGIYGRSNGGVLTSVSITQHPELFNAAVIESPLIDMLRYNHLSAGASWVAEYGDPDIPADRAFIADYSAYTHVKPGVIYPEPYITTNTEDDRVHPGHARKFAAKFETLGLPYLYYKNTFGGHANNADPELNARRWARHYVYLARRLMD